MTLLTNVDDLIIDFIDWIGNFVLKVRKILGFREQPPARRGFYDTEDYFPWLEGTRIYNGGRKMVVKCNGPDGMVARKVSKGSLPAEDLRTEAYMGKYAWKVAGMKVPAFRSLEVNGENSIITTDLDPGCSLDGLWHKLTYKNQASIKQELKQQIQLMRRCSTNRLCCVNEHGDFDTKIRIPNPHMPCIVTGYTLPCADEATCDANKIKVIKRYGPRRMAQSIVRRLRPKIKEVSKEYTGRFVLTHGDLSACNILVQDVNKDDPKKKPYYVLSSIIDWQFSGFFPEYMEYAIQMTSSSGNLRWHHMIRSLLEEIGADCSSTRLEVEQMTRNWLD